MACLIVMDGSLKGQRFTLEQSVSRIGRREGNDWVLQDGSVSGTHCEIEKNATGFLIRDLGSTNGTKVNNEPIKEKALFRNDILMIGEISVMIEGEDVPNTAKNDPQSIPRTTIVIKQKRHIATPKEFTKKSSTNKIWGVVIAVLILVIVGLLFLFLKGSQTAG